MSRSALAIVFWSQWTYYLILSFRLELNENLAKSSSESDVLLIYVYANTHSYAYENLKYFIENAVRENDGVDYYFILQRVNNKEVDESALPKLKGGNAHYIQHDNVCYDFGTIGWFFDEFTYGNPWKKQINDPKKLNLLKYKYFILNECIDSWAFFPAVFSSISIGL